MTYRYGPVVCGVDGSPASLGALRWAADEACRCTRMLLVVTVLAGDDADGDIAARAAAEAGRWRVGTAVTAETHRGEPAEVLRSLAGGARLVVVGGRGSGPADERPMGSVSQALGARADAPVLIVHAAERWAAPDATLPRTAPVVTGFDGSDSGHRALRLAFEEAAARGVRLAVIQAWPHPHLWHPGSARGGDLGPQQHAVREALARATARWRADFPMVDVEVRSEPGEAVHALVVASQWAGLLVVGTRCPGDHVPPAGASVAQRVLEYAACPVLIAHGQVAAATPHAAA
ncbi:universal stress protein [Dactylosporangium matsuzakiense]|uniref:Universal stress protein n=1 Tax=Dactylosporangium matsuzakiense TaxID=53360 RepID=A0A9W6KG60_9ACTN|nr:universal stress protein [Dactylosporangium matsuzakiense]UWZ48237.1 universal stress protein [Dactylosporangium matsuzakiense]GLL01472.1 universal stress protein [Dactylosporangium matsuzakiense]